MHIFDIVDKRAIESGLMVKNPTRNYVSDHDVSAEAFGWLRHYCGTFEPSRFILKRWYRGDAGWSLTVYHHTALRKNHVRVVIRDARAAMLFKLTWT